MTTGKSPDQFKTGNGTRLKPLKGKDTEAESKLEAESVTVMAVQTHLYSFAEYAVRGFKGRRALKHTGLVDIDSKNI